MLTLYLICSLYFLLYMIEFSEFLKKYSTIPNQFIDDFFKIIKNYNDFDNLFYINLDVVTRWVNKKKSNIKRTLVKKFSKNIDYSIEKIEVGRGKPKENILLKSSTFKKLCMMLNNKKAKEVREYFMKVEETLDKYRKKHFVFFSRVLFHDVK
jgi:phage anti-repressor protein